MSTPPPFGMSSPPPPPPPASSRKGCFIAIAAALVVLLVLCLVGCFIVAKNPGRMMAWGITSAKKGFEQSIAADVPASTREQFMTEIDAHAEWLRSAGPEDMKAKGQAIAAPMQYIQGAMADKSLSLEECQQFIKLSMELRGATPPPPPPPPPVEEPMAPPPADGAPPTDGAGGATAPPTTP